jgi:hypothetical protein
VFAKAEEVRLLQAQGRDSWASRAIRRSSASSWRGKAFPYSHIGTAQGQAIFRALAEVSPNVIRTLHDATKAPS